MLVKLTKVRLSNKALANICIVPWSVRCLQGSSSHLKSSHLGFVSPNEAIGMNKDTIMNSTQLGQGIVPKPTPFLQQ